MASRPTIMEYGLDLPTNPGLPTNPYVTRNLLALHIE